MEIAKGIGLARIGRHARHFDEDIRTFGKCYRLLDRRSRCCALLAIEAEMIDDEFEVRMAERDRADFGEPMWCIDHYRNAGRFGSRPEPVCGAVAHGGTCMWVLECQAHPEHALLLHPCRHERTALRSIERDFAHDCEAIRIFRDRLVA